MSFGDAYRHIRLLDEAGREVPRAFLQTAHELWDARRQRFTLILDPGRIKRGLRSNVEVGAPLREGGRYRLVDRPPTGATATAIRCANRSRSDSASSPPTAPRPNLTPGS